MASARLDKTGGDASLLWQNPDLRDFLTDSSKWGGELLQNWSTSHTLVRKPPVKDCSGIHSLLVHRGLVAALLVIFWNPHRKESISMDFICHFMLEMPLPWLVPPLDRHQQQQQPDLPPDPSSWQLEHQDLIHLCVICKEALAMKQSEISPQGKFDGVVSWSCQVLIKILGKATIMLYVYIGMYIYIYWCLLSLSYTVCIRMKSKYDDLFHNCRSQVAVY